MPWARAKVEQLYLDRIISEQLYDLKNKEEGYTGGGYDVTKATAKMDNTLKNANLKSLMYDDVLENGEPFATAIKANPEITGMTYESLGLMEKDIVAKVDTNKDGIIQDSEKKTLLELGHQDMIVDALTNPDNDLYDEERTRGLMANYFTKFVSTQYENEYSANGGKYTSDAVGQYGDDPQSQADEFMKQNNII